MYEREIEALVPELTELYRDLHRHPEPGYMEHRTAGIVARYLRDCGLEVTEGVALNGVVGMLDSGKPGRTVMLRADMDCLRVAEQTGCEFASQTPGCMHACGHDAHVTMLLGTAKVLARHREAFCGRIKFVFQPAEEQIDPSMKQAVQEAGYLGEGGAGFMVQERVLEGVDACLVLHNQPSLPVGVVQIARKDACASSDVFRITLQGKGGHGARPHEAVDPVPAMTQLVDSIHLIPSREVSCLETCVISIGVVETPGSVWNAVADQVKISGGFRTFNSQVRQLIHRRIGELARDIAAAHRCTAQVEFTTGYMPTINDEKLAGLVAGYCKELLGEDRVQLTQEPAMTSEDAGEYLARVPGVFFWLGSGDPAHALHSPYFLPDPQTIPIGVRVQVNNAVSLLKTLNEG